jgi:8-oxo-dGTP pyrophosphatase MutT (NUDIX family)
MRIVYAKQTPPESWQHAIFLAGPTPRDPETPSWRPEAIRILEELGYEGVVFVPEPEGGDWRGSYTDQANWERMGTVFVPEPEDGQWRGSYTDQTEWEKMGTEMADKVVFWVPRDLRTMPALTTNIEFGRYVDTGKAVLGHPEGAPKMRYLDWLVTDADPDGGWYHDLRATLQAATLGWDKLPVRSGGERWVPAVIFTTPMFQSWYGQLCEVGNRLDKAGVRWTFRLKGRVFSYVLWVDIWVQSEGRHKANEWIFARTDVACVVLYARAADPMDSKVVLVREFRSPARTPDGFVHELPGGGCEAADDDALERAAREVYEETGIAVAKERLRYVGSRQAVATLSTHQVHCYAVEMTDAELAQAAAVAASGEAHGEDGPGGEEQAYTEITTLGELLQGEYADWTTVGLVARALMNPNA